MDPSAEQTRPLAEIEADLLTAEKEFQDAASRLNNAKQDLETALRRINQHQDELDSAMAGLRQRSAPGSHWRASSSGPGELLLSAEHVSELPVSAGAADGQNAKIHNLAVH